MSKPEQPAGEHRLSCKTCGHHKIVGEIPDIEDCDAMDHTPTREELKLIRQMGCATHTSAQQQRIERDK